nr:MAG TPA: hypothetical protein [Caudoviricetes sp.]
MLNIQKKVLTKSKIFAILLLFQKEQERRKNHDI